MGDVPPTKQPPTEYKWMIDHQENVTGTDRKYMPYSTTRPKIEAWKPPSAS